MRKLTAEEVQETHAQQHIRYPGAVARAEGASYPAISWRQGTARVEAGVEENQSTASQATGTGNNESTCRLQPETTERFGPVRISDIKPSIRGVAARLTQEPSLCDRVKATAKRFTFCKQG
jgi:hypothetical protein